jgi:SAM-dependent methyltransferase
MSISHTHRQDEQRLAFGRVAELYDHARPSYPTACIDAVIEFGALEPPARILEVGAGTGKATVLLAERGFGIIGLEPSAEMARVARANCAAYPDVEIVECEFERWRPPEPLPALISTQAWHWIDAERRYECARAALLPGGVLAAIWTFPDWGACVLRSALSDAYQRAAPDLAADFPMHPDSESTRLAADWRREITAASGFGLGEAQMYRWSMPYSGGQYTDLLQTHQDHILLDAGRRRRLLEAIAGAIADAGGTLTMPFVTYVCLAKRRE